MAAVTVAAVLVGADGKLKSSPSAGYCPEDARWVAVSQDFAGFWEGVEGAILEARLAPQGYYPLGDWERSFRMRAGIRPTPGRWGLWFGPRLLAAGSGDGVGLCVRPGILLRALGLCHGLVAGGPSESGVRRFGETAYGWRDGFLVFSESPAYVEAALRAPPYAADSEPGARQVELRWRGEPQGRIVISGEEDLPVEGWVETPFEDRDAPLTLAGIWPESPLLSVTGFRLADLASLTEDFVAALPWGDLPGRWWDEARAVAGGEWSEGGEEYAFALLDLDTSEFLPIPEMAVVLRGVEEGLPPPPGDALLYEWAGHPGWALPCMGEKLTLCVAARERDRFVTSAEPLMAAVLGTAAEGASSLADVAVTADWSRWSRVAAALLRSAAAHELVPRMNGRDVERKLIPFAEMVAHLGVLEVEGSVEGTQLHFRGFLAGPVGGSGS